MKDDLEYLGNFYAYPRLYAYVSGNFRRIRVNDAALARRAVREVYTYVCGYVVFGVCGVLDKTPNLFQELVIDSYKKSSDSLLEELESLHVDVGRRILHLSPVVPKKELVKRLEYARGIPVYKVKQFLDYRASLQRSGAPERIVEEKCQHRATSIKGLHAGIIARTNTEKMVKEAYRVFKEIGRGEVVHTP